MIPLFLTWVIRQVRVPFMKTVTRDGPFMDHRLVAGKGAYVTQWRYEPCHAGSPKTNRSKWRVQTKHDPLEERMANHSSILAARTPWTVWKGKKIWHQKMRPPGWKVSYMLLGKSRGQSLIAMKCWDSITNSMYMNLSKLWEILKDRGAWRAEVHGVAKSWTQPGDWTTTTANL